MNASAKQLAATDYQFCIIEGIALPRWGEPRTTSDIDVTIITGFGNEEAGVMELMSRFPPRFDDVLEFSRMNRMALRQTQDGIEIDVCLGALPYEKRVAGRSSTWAIASHGILRTCCAEDLIVLKAFATRPQDWIDVEGVIIRQGNKLDRKLIIEELTPLTELKEEPEILDQLQLLFDKHPSQI